MDKRKWDFRNIDWLSPKPSKERVVIGVGVIALVAGGVWLFGQGEGDGKREARAPDGASSREGVATDTPAGSIQVARPGPVPLERLEAGTCSSFAPAGWKVTDHNKDGTAFTMASADGRLIASYAGLAVGAGQVAGYYGPQYRDPRTLALYLAGVLSGEQAQADGADEPVGAYRAMRFHTATRQGYVLSYRFPVPDPQGYGVIYRFAMGEAGDAKSMGLAGAAAAAARCTAQLHPSEGPVYHAPRDDHGTGRTGAGSDSDLAGTYNAQLGTGWVHDDAGRNYNVDVTADWNASGPDGPGYYKRNGNDVTKLTPGMM